MNLRFYVYLLNPVVNNKFSEHFEDFIAYFSDLGPFCPKLQPTLFDLACSPGVKLIGKIEIILSGGFFCKGWLILYDFLILKLKEELEVLGFLDSGQKISGSKRRLCCKNLKIEISDRKPVAAEK